MVDLTIAKDRKTKIFGLKYEPYFVQEDLNYLDSIPELFTKEVKPVSGNGQFSSRNGKVLMKAIDKIKPKNVLEIGVARHTHYQNSSTNIFIENKPDDCFYFGVDLDMAVKMQYEAVRPNVHLLGHNSADTEIVMDRIPPFNPDFKEFDIIFIDGFHSIEMMVNDWRYVEYLKVGGKVLIHDTNFHPCKFIYEAIDREYFKVEKFFTHRDDDNGLIVAERLK